MEKHSFIDGDYIVLETEQQMMDFIVVLLRNQIVIEEPLALANEIAEEEDFSFQEDAYQAAESLGLLDVEEDFKLNTPKEERVAVSEGEHVLRTTYKTYPKSRTDYINNKFVEIYDILSEAHQDACAGHVDLHGEDTFNMSTVFLHTEIADAKSALSTAKLLITKAMTNELITK